MKRLSLAAIILLLGCVFAFGQQGLSAISLVPAKSIAVVRVDWTKVRRDQQLNKVVRGDDFARIVEQTGVSETKVEEFVIFADVNPTSSGKMGLIVNGIFSSAVIIKNLESKGWKSEKVGSRIGYVNPSDNSYLVPLKDGIFVAGTKTAVEQTSETLANPQTALIHKATFRSIMSTLGTSAPIRFFMGVPEEYQGVANFAFKIFTKVLSFTGLGIVGMVFDHIGLIQSVGFSMDSGRTSNPVHCIFVMPGKTEATLASGALNLLKSGASMLNYSDADKAVLKTMIFWKYREFVVDQNGYAAKHNAGKVKWEKHNEENCLPMGYNAFLS